MTLLPLDVHPEAAQELQEAMDWYEDAREGYGQQFVDAVLHALEHGIPRTLDVSQELGEGNTFRRYLLRRFPYTLIVLEPPKGSPELLAVSHQKRHPLYWISRATPGEEGPGRPRHPRR